MTRLHLHLRVSDLGASRAYYSALLGAPPTTERDDYLRWKLDDPPLALALSTTEGDVGVDHLGLEAVDPRGLAALDAASQATGRSVGSAAAREACCYAVSDKRWSVDPDGLAWEAFHTLEDSDEGSCPMPEPGSADEACAPGAPCCDGRDDCC